MKTKIKIHFFPWYTELSNRIHSSFGNNNSTALQNVLLYLLEQMSLEMKKIIKKERIKRAQKLYVVLNDFLVYFHAHQLTLKQEKIVSCEYAFICLLSHAVDLHILLSQGDNFSPHINYAVRDLFIHLGKGNLYTWDVLLHCSLLKKKYFNIVNPVLHWQIVLDLQSLSLWSCTFLASDLEFLQAVETRNASMILSISSYTSVILCVIQNVPDKLDDPEHYMKFIVLLHLWKVQSTGKTEKDRVISFGLKVKPPINLSAWLTALSLEGMPAPPVNPSAKKLVKYFFNKKFPSTLFKQIRKILCTELSSEKFETVPVSSEQLEEHGNGSTGSFFIDKGKNPVVGENPTANEDGKELTEDEYIEKLLSNLPTDPEHYENTVDNKDMFYLMQENQSELCSKNKSSSGSHKKVFSSSLSTQNYIKSVVLSDAPNDTTSIGPGLIEQESLEIDDLSELPRVLDNKKHGGKKNRKAKKTSSESFSILSETITDVCTKEKESNGYCTKLLSADEKLSNIGNISLPSQNLSSVCDEREEYIPNTQIEDQNDLFDITCSSKPSRNKKKKRITMTEFEKSPGNINSSKMQKSKKKGTNLKAENSSPTDPENYENTVDLKDMFYMMQENQSELCSKNESSSGSHKRMFSSPPSTQNYIKSVVLSDALNDDTSMGCGLIEQESLEIDDLSELPCVLDNKKHGGKKNRKAKKTSSESFSILSETITDVCTKEKEFDGFCTKLLSTDEELSNIGNISLASQNLSSVCAEREEYIPNTQIEDQNDLFDITCSSKPSRNKKKKQITMTEFEKSPGNINSSKIQKSKKKGTNLKAKNSSPTDPENYENTVDLKDMFYMMQENQSELCSKNESSSGSHKRMFSSPPSTQNYIKSVVLSDALNDDTSMGCGLIEQESLEMDDLSELPCVLDNKKHGEKKNRKAKKTSSESFSILSETITDVCTKEKESNGFCTKLLSTDEELSNIGNISLASQNLSSVCAEREEYIPNTQIEDQNDLFDITCSSKPGRNKKMKQIMTEFKKSPGSINSSEILKSKKKKSTNLKAKNSFSFDGKSYDNTSNISIVDNKNIEIYGNIYSSPQSKIVCQDEDSTYVQTKKQSLPAVEYDVQILTDDANSLDVFRSPVKQVKRLDAKINSLSLESDVEQSESHLEPSGSSGGNSSNVHECSPAITSPSIKSRTTIFESICNDQEVAAPVESDDEASDLDFTVFLKNSLEIPEIAEDSVAVNNFTVPSITPNSSPGSLVSQLYSFCETLESPEKCSGKNESFDLGAAKMVDALNSGQKVNKLKTKQNFFQNVEQEDPCDNECKNTSLEHKTSICTDDKSLRNTKYTSPQSLDLIFSKQRKQQNIVITDSKKLESLSNQESFSELDVVNTELKNIYADFHTPCKISSDHSLRSSEKKYLNGNKSPSEVKYITLSPFHSNNLCLSQSPDKSFVNQIDNTLPKKSETQVGALHFTPSKKLGKFPEKEKTLYQLCHSTCQITTDINLEHSPRLQREKETPCKKMCVNDFSENHKSDEDNFQNTCSDIKQSTNSIGANVSECFPKLRISPKMSPKKLDLTSMINCNEKLDGKEENSQYELSDMNQSGGGLMQFPRRKKSFESPCAKLLISDFGQNHNNICNEGNSQYPSSNVKQCNDIADTNIILEQSPNLIKKVKVSLKKINLSQNDFYEKLEGKNSQCELPYENQDNITTDTVLRQSPRLKNSGTPYDKLHVNDDISHYESSQCKKPNEKQSTKTEGANNVLEQCPHLRKSPKMSPKKLEELSKAVACEKHEGKGENLQCKLSNVHQDSIIPNIVARLSPKQKKCSESPGTKLDVNGFSKNHKDNEVNSHCINSNGKDTDSLDTETVLKQSPDLGKSTQMPPKKLDIMSQTDSFEDIESSQYKLSDNQQDSITFDTVVRQSPRQRKCCGSPHAKLCVGFSENYENSEENSQYSSSDIEQHASSVNTNAHLEQSPDHRKSSRMSPKNIGKGANVHCKLSGLYQDGVAFDTVVVRQSPRLRKNSETLRDKSHVNDAISHYECSQCKNFDERQSTKIEGVNNVLEQCPYLRKSPKMSSKKLEELFKAVACEKHEGKGENLQCKLSNVHQDSIIPNIVARLSPKQRKCSDSPGTKLEVNGFSKNHKDNEVNSHCINSNGKDTDSLNTETVLKQSPDLGKSTQMSPKNLDIMSQTDSFEDIESSQYKLSDNQQDSVTFDTVVRQSPRQRKCCGSPHTKLCVGFSENYENSEENSQYSSSDIEQHASSVNTNAHLEQSPDHRKSSRMSPKNIGKGANVHCKLSGLYQDGVAFDTVVVRQSPRLRKNSETLRDKSHVNDAISHYECSQCKNLDERQSTKIEGVNNVLEQCPYLRKSPKMSPKKLEELFKAVACEKHEGKGENLQCKLSNVHQDSIIPNIVARLSPKQRKCSESPGTKLDVNSFSKNHKDNEVNSHCINSNGKDTDGLDTETVLKQSPDLGKSTQMSPKNLDIMSQTDSFEDIESSQYKLSDNQQDSVTFDTFVRQSPRQRKCCGSPKLCVGFSENYENSKETSQYSSSDIEQHANSVNTNARLEQSPSPKNIGKGDNVHCKLSDLYQDGVNFDTIVRQSPRQRKSSESLYANDFSKSYESNKENSLYTSSDTEQCANSVNTNADLEQSPNHRKKPRMSPKNLSRGENTHCKLSNLHQDSVTFDTIVVIQSPGQRKSSESPHSKLHVNDFSKNVKDNKENHQHTSSDMEQCFSNENTNTGLEQSPNLRSPGMLSRNLDKEQNSQYKLSNMNQDSVIIDTSVSQSPRRRKNSESPYVTLCINGSENHKNNEENFQYTSSDMDANVLKQSPNLRKSSKVSPKKSKSESPKCSTKSQTLDNTNDSVLEDYSFDASLKLTTKSRTEVNAVQNEYFSNDIVHKENIQKKRKLYPQATRYRAKASTISDSPLYDIVHIFQSPEKHKTSLNSLDSSVQGTSTIKHSPGIDSSPEKNLNLTVGKLPSFNMNREKRLKTPSPSVFPSPIKIYSSKRKKNYMYTSIGQTFKMLRLNSTAEISDRSSHDSTPEDKLSPNMLNSSTKLRSSTSRQSPFNSLKSTSNSFSVKLVSPTKSKLQVKPETAMKHLSPKDSSNSEGCLDTVPLSIRKRKSGVVTRSSSKIGYNLRPRSSISTPTKLNF